MTRYEVILKRATDNNADWFLQTATHLIYVVYDEVREARVAHDYSFDTDGECVATNWYIV